MNWLGRVLLLAWLGCLSAWTQSPPRVSLQPDGGLGQSQSKQAMQPRTLPPAANERVYVGNEACAKCHAEISRSYVLTPMARASGPAIQNLIPADFVHSNSGVHYWIDSDAGRVWLHFERPRDPAVRGKRELLYYIGSGRRGLSYLFAEDGFLFESPINWYTHERRWDMAPAYQDAHEMPLNLPAFTSCLRCHVSGMQPPVKGTENRYPTPPFLHNGVTCERCHGPGRAHVDRPASGAIVNPAKLTPELRDAVCMQCHLEGKVAIERPGRHAYEFRPGESLTEYVRYYVPAGDQGAGLGGVSQVEAMAQSVCKQKSGDHMSCTSCHDPHYEPTSEERDAYFRKKCLACHGADFGAKHHAAQLDCTSCHMPAAASTDVAHTQVTDHRIPRIPNRQLSVKQGKQDGGFPAAKLRLVPFPDSAETEKDVRDLALAWQSLVGEGVEAAEAEALLRSAAAKFPNDPDVLVALAYVEQRHASTDEARQLYKRALTLDPDSIDAATNLAVIEARSRHVDEAIELWEGAFRRAPGRSSLGMNLAVTFCNEKRFDDARNAVLRVLEFNPDLGQAKEILQSLNRTPPSCGE